jgi:acyl carrier protein
MSEIRDQLIRCFSATFPNLTSEEVQAASPNSVEAWDSLASITLIAVLEEEFAIQIEPEDIEHLVSFDKVLEYLTKRLPRALTNHT